MYCLSFSGGGSVFESRVPFPLGGGLALIGCSERGESKTSVLVIELLAQLRRSGDSIIANGLSDGGGRESETREGSGGEQDRFGNFHIF